MYNVQMKIIFILTILLKNVIGSLLFPSSRDYLSDILQICIIQNAMQVMRLSEVPLSEIRII